ncbi:hypothetical protein AYI68_g5752 [Smittium mucronatum]|uniref:Uncharacterized protein n=1 Tax=Smittium mucronatum TaxID=133383 RepID=A0A1R0GTC8_9FUNG|nr:hypothetical protein AYI68_g5752 [Smittium mucronatum]
MTELEAYPELLQTIPAMQEDFFRSQMTEEKRKDIIYACPKVTGLNYIPPLLNDTALNTVKKLDSMLYGIQLTLANMARKIDYFVHNRIRNNPGAKPETDDALELAEIMRILISDLESSIIQSRVDTLYKSMELPGKAPQLLESANKPSVDQEKLDALLFSKKTERKPRKMGYKKPFL